MDDSIIINEFIKGNKILPQKTNIKWLLDNPEYKEYLDHRYEEPFEKYTEVISRIFYGIENKPCCKVCGKVLPFRSFKKPYSIWCNQQCQLRDKDFIKNRESKIDKKKSFEKSKITRLLRYGNENYSNREKAKQTCLKKYGVEVPLKSEIIRNKGRETIQKKYGVDNISKSPEIIKKIYDTKLKKYGDGYYVNRDKMIKTCLKKYGVDNYMDTLEFSKIRNSKEVWEKSSKSIKKTYKNDSKKIETKKVKTNLEKYGVKYYSELQEYKDRVYNTKKKHNSFNTSSIEQQLKNYFEEQLIDFKYQYKSNIYPFSCDFYFPKNNLYLEIQGTWTHGPHSYTGSKEDQKLLKKWASKKSKFYKNAINTWTILDVKKRQHAKEHNINLIEIYSIDFEEIIKILNEYL